MEVKAINNSLNVLNFEGKIKDTITNKQQIIIQNHKDIFQKIQVKQCEI